MRADINSPATINFKSINTSDHIIIQNVDSEGEGEGEGEGRKKEVSTHHKGASL